MMITLDIVGSPLLLKLADELVYIFGNDVWDGTTGNKLLVNTACLILAPYKRSSTNI